MTPKEKAKKLVYKYVQYTAAEYKYAIECAKITVEEIISNTDMYVGNVNPKWSFWQEVKQELDKL